MIDINEWLKGCTKIESYIVKPTEQNSKNFSVIYSSLSDESETDKNSQSQLWGKVFEFHYKNIQGRSDAISNTDVWKNSYDGTPVPKGEMKEWVDNTISRIESSLSPESKVLEVGCGNGLIFSSIIDDIFSYIGCDPAETALTSISTSQLGDLHKEKINLYCLDAMDIDKIPVEEFDLIIINSVAQYFSSVDYLLRFISKLQAYSHEKTHIYFGDLRSFDLQQLFYFDILSFKFGQEKVANEYPELIENLLLREKETLYHADLFRILPKIFNWIADVQINLKAGEFQNELVKYRFDSLVSCNHSSISDTPDLKNFNWADNEITTAELEERIKLMTNQVLEVYNIPNRRLIDVVTNYRKITGLNYGNPVEKIVDIKDHLSTNVSFYYEIAARNQISVNVDYMESDNTRFKATLFHAGSFQTTVPSDVINLENLSNRISGPPSKMDKEFEAEIKATFDGVEVIRASPLLLDLYK